MQYEPYSPAGIDKEHLINPAVALQYEWLETNGLGAYAMSTPYGCHTRKYHGLLVAPFGDQSERFVFLSKYLVSAVQEGVQFDLSVTRYPGVYAPSGNQYMERFDCGAGYPQLCYAAGRARILQSLLMLQGRHTVLVKFDVHNTSHPVTFQCSPLLAFRNHHHLHRKNMDASLFMEGAGAGRWSAQLYTALPPLYFRACAEEGATRRDAEFFPAPDWYHNVEYPKERARGYDCTEDLCTPGVFEIEVASGGSFIMEASLHQETETPYALWNEEARRRDAEIKLLRAHTAKRNSSAHVSTFLKKAAKAAAKEGTKEISKEQSKEHVVKTIGDVSTAAESSHIPMHGSVHIPAHNEKNYGGAYELLARSARKFLIGEKRESLPSVIAGYPWFGEWGRDSMISAAGLTLYNGLEEYFPRILQTYASFGREGLFPNQLNVHGASSFNCVDASLWFFWALRIYVNFYAKKTRVKEREARAALAQHFAAPMHRIIAAFINGTVPHVAMDGMGFLSAGDQSTQLTWMDAVVDGQPVTPRSGFPVDINALWYNALHLFSQLFPQELSGELRLVPDVRASLEEHFQSRYYNERIGCLCDSIEEGVQVDHIRPNQLLALSSSLQLVDDDIARESFETISHHLLTPCGIRTLSLADPLYLGQYHGAQRERDRAYHQGSAWPFLFGMYTDALLRVRGDKENGGVQQLLEYRALLHDFIQTSVYARGIGGIAELHDGDVPHTPRGCPFQAWSAAEVIRSISLLEEVLR